MITGQRLGYLRVSSVDQNLDRQLDGVPVERTFTDNASGKDVHRPQLEALLSFVRDGDTVIVHSWTGWPATSMIFVASCGG